VKLYLPSPIYTHGVHNENYFSQQTLIDQEEYDWRCTQHLLDKNAYQVAGGKSERKRPFGTL
jgi:hypothetical protein